jgi:hypothetical protein
MTRLCDVPLLCHDTLFTASANPALPFFSWLLICHMPFS